MAAGSYNIVCDQGATFSLALTYKDGNNDPINLTGCTARMQVRQRFDSGSTILSLTNTSGLALGTTNGRIVITISATATAALEPGDFIYDLEIQSADTAVTRIIQGKFKTRPEVTR